MLLNSPADKSGNPAAEPTGILYVVATPIGHWDDITLRAIRTLTEVNLIAAEDTRHTGALLAHHHIQTPLVSYHEHNELSRSSQLIEKMKYGLSIALVSDAGTPSISDPGYRLVKASIENNIRVVPIPGASAAVAALSASGLPTDAFIFMGFAPKKHRRRAEQLRELAKESRTVIFYESPRRIISFLEEIKLAMGDRYVVVSREMTKHHEEFLRGDIGHVLHVLKERPVVKGECTLLVSGCGKKEPAMSEEIIDEIRDRLKRQDTPPSSLAKEIARVYGLPRSIVYETIVGINCAAETRKKS